MLEKFTYGLLILTSSVALVAIVDRGFVGSAPSGSTEQQFVNRSIKLSGVDYGSRNVILAVSTHCHFCSASLPFYSKLARMRSVAFPFKLIIVAPESMSEVRSYLAKEHVDPDKVISKPLSDISITGTPTLLVLDHSGIVREAFVGKLSPAREQAVVNTIKRL